eukprot:Rmarinus@m.19558
MSDDVAGRKAASASKALYEPWDSVLSNKFPQASVLSVEPSEPNPSSSNTLFSDSESSERAQNRDSWSGLSAISQDLRTHEFVREPTAVPTGNSPNPYDPPYLAREGLPMDYLCLDSASHTRRSSASTRTSRTSSTITVALSQGIEDADEDGLSYCSRPFWPAPPRSHSSAKSISSDSYSSSSTPYSYSGSSTPASAHEDGEYPTRQHVSPRNTLRNRVLRKSVSAPLTPAAAGTTTSNAAPGVFGAVRSTVTPLPAPASTAPSASAQVVPPSHGTSAASPMSTLTISRPAPAPSAPSCFRLPGSPDSLARRSWFKKSRSTHSAPPDLTGNSLLLPPSALSVRTSGLDALPESLSSSPRSFAGQPPGYLDGLGTAMDELSVISSDGPGSSHPQSHASSRSQTPPTSHRTSPRPQPDEDVTRLYLHHMLKLDLGDDFQESSSSSLFSPPKSQEIPCPPDGHDTLPSYTYPSSQPIGSPPRLRSMEGGGCSCHPSAPGSSNQQQGTPSFHSASRPPVGAPLTQSQSQWSTSQQSHLAVRPPQQASHAQQLNQQYSGSSSQHQPSQHQPTAPFSLQPPQQQQQQQSHLQSHHQPNSQHQHQHQHQHQLQHQHQHHQLQLSSHQHHHPHQLPPQHPASLDSSSSPSPTPSLFRQHSHPVIGQRFEEQLSSSPPKSLPSQDMYSKFGSQVPHSCPTCSSPLLQHNQEVSSSSGHGSGSSFYSQQGSSYMGSPQDRFHVGMNANNAPLSSSGNSSQQPSPQGQHLIGASSSMQPGAYASFAGRQSPPTENPARALSPPLSHTQSNSAFSHSHLPSHSHSYHSQSQSHGHLSSHAMPAKLNHSHSLPQHLSQPQQGHGHPAPAVHNQAGLLSTSQPPSHHTAQSSPPNQPQAAHSSHSVPHMFSQGSTGSAFCSGPPSSAAPLVGTTPASSSGFAPGHGALSSRASSSSDLLNPGLYPTSASSLLPQQNAPGLLSVHSHVHFHPSSSRSGTLSPDDSLDRSGRRRRPTRRGRGGKKLAQGREAAEYLGILYPPKDENGAYLYWTSACERKISPSPRAGPASSG